MAGELMVEVITELLSPGALMAFADNKHQLCLRGHLFHLPRRLVVVVCEPHHTTAMAIAAVDNIDPDLADRLAVSLSIRMQNSVIEIHDVGSVLSGRIASAINAQIKHL